MDGETDLPNVAELQERLKLTPTAPGDGVPDGDRWVPEDLRFFAQLRVWTAAFPPSARGRAYQRRFGPLGLLDPQSPYTDASSAQADMLREAHGSAGQKMEEDRARVTLQRLRTAGA